MEELCSSTEVDVVLVSSATAFHPDHAILALKNDKHVLVEKPAAINYRDISAMIDAEKRSRGSISVGYQRRYAEAFLDAIGEIGGMGKIQYARVRGMEIYHGFRSLADRESYRYHWEEQHFSRAIWDLSEEVWGL